MHQSGLCQSESGNNSSASSREPVFSFGLTVISATEPQGQIPVSTADPVTAGAWASTRP
jgi:hypothetical protein